MGDAPSPAPGNDQVGTCSSCGAAGEPLAALHRVYLVPEPSRLDELEWWCAACRSQYPHAPAGG